MPIRVILTDDHLMVREGISQLLELDKNIKVVGQAKDGVECMDLLKKLEADVLLLDINMPVMNGIEVIKKIKEEKIKIKIMVLTIHNEIDYILKAVDLGVHGYMLKDSDSSELITGIQTIFSGEPYIQPSLLPMLNNKLVERDSDKEKIEIITNREMEVLKLLAEGLFNKEIASRLGISERTVKNHVSNLFKKIEVSDRTQAAIFAVKNDIVNI